MITKKRGEPSRLFQQDRPYNFISRMGMEEKALLRRAQDRMRENLGDYPSNQVLMMKLLRDYVEAGNA